MLNEEGKNYDVEEDTGGGGPQAPMVMLLNIENCRARYKPERASPASCVIRNQRGGIRSSTSHRDGDALGLHRHYISSLPPPPAHVHIFQPAAYVYGENASNVVSWS